MDTQAERTWNKRLRSARRDVRDAKRKRRVAITGFIVFLSGAAGLVVCCVLVNIGFILAVLVWLTVGAGIIVAFMGEIADAFGDVLHAKDELEDLQEAYGYAMMEAYEREVQ